MASTFKLSYTGSQIDDRLSLIDTLQEKIYNLEATLSKSYFQIDEEGVISLKPEYEAEGSQNASLLKHLIIPNEIDGTQVLSLKIGMFDNNLAVEEITLPDTVTVIPEKFCSFAKRLRKLNNTLNIKEIQKSAFQATKIKKLNFENLSVFNAHALQGACHLKEVNIGNNITTIPSHAFANCPCLEKIIGGKNITSIEAKAFLKDYSLSNKSNDYFLTKDAPAITVVGPQAFYGTNVSTNKEPGNTISSTAFPTFRYQKDENGKYFWENVKPIVIPNINNEPKLRFNQREFGTTTIGDSNLTYAEWGCTIISALYIYAALTNDTDTSHDPIWFVDFLTEQGLEDYLPTGNQWIGNSITNLGNLLKELLPESEYEVKIYDFDNNLAGQTVNEDTYLDLLSALNKQDSYVCTRAISIKEEAGTSKIGHAVVLYGLNESGDVKVLETSHAFSVFSPEPLEFDPFTYTTAYHNLVGPLCGFVTASRKNT